MAPRFTILAVCTGNICRSPAMERLLAQVFHHEPQVTVISAGTHAHDGEDIQAPMKQLITDYGADAQDFIAKQVTVDMIESADLIVAATRVHIEDMLAEVPAARARTFTLPEFGRLLDTLAPDALAQAAGSDASLTQRLAALVPLVDQAREEGAGDNSEDEIVDPYLLPGSVFDESFRQIREPTQALAGVLRLNN